MKTACSTAAGSSRVAAAARRRPSAAALPLLLLPLLLGSCASAPSARRQVDWIAVLPPAGLTALYLSVDVASSRPLLQELVQSAGGADLEIDRILVRTRQLYCRIELSASGLHSLALIALADLTPNGAALRLDHNAEWQRLVLEPIAAAGRWSSHWPYRTYWRQRSSGLEVAVPQRGVVFLCRGFKESSSTGMRGMLSGLHAPSVNPLLPEAIDALQSSDLFLYSPDVASVAGAVRPEAGADSQVPRGGALPLKEMWAGIEQNEGSYRLQAVLRLEEGRNPRSVEALLRLLLTVWLRRADVENPAALAKSLEISADSESARLCAAQLREQEIISLFRLFLSGLFDRGSLRG